MNFFVNKTGLPCISFKEEAFMFGFKVDDWVYCGLPPKNVEAKKTDAWNRAFNTAMMLKTKFCKAQLKSFFRGEYFEAEADMNNLLNSFRKQLVGFIVGEQIPYYMREYILKDLGIYHRYYTYDDYFVKNKTSVILEGYKRTKFQVSFVDNVPWKNVFVDKLVQLGAIDDVLNNKLDKIPEKLRRYVAKLPVSILLQAQF